MAVDSVSSNTNVSATTQSQRTPTSSAEGLGKDAFLQILVAQMANQDPLSPTSDTEFIAQMAQFSTLEQMQNMNVAMQTQTAYSYLGKDITAAYVADAEGNLHRQDVYGRVLGISHYNGNNYLQVQDYNTGEICLVAPDQVLQAIEGATTLETQMGQMLALMGQLVVNTTPKAEEEAAQEQPEEKPAEQQPAEDAVEV